MEKNERKLQFFIVSNILERFIETDRRLLLLQTIKPENIRIKCQLHMHGGFLMIISLFFSLNYNCKIDYFIEIDDLLT